jgi:imidazolonepropionase
MPVLRNIRTLATPRAALGPSALEVIDDAALAFREGTIRWVGKAAALPAREDDGEHRDAGGCLVIPGLVDCHTHLAFGGWRAAEYVQRLGGASYSEIARAGGGILSTVKQTRALAAEELLERAEGFVREMVALGTTTIEAKSGYGLDRDTELRILDVYRRLAGKGLARVVPTYLGAHVVPPEYRPGDRRAEYVAFMCTEMIPHVTANRLARFGDVFVDEGAFTVAEARQIGAAARAAGLGVKVHADQIGDDGGAALAAELGAISADHLEHVSPLGIAELARAGVVAVSLPIAALYLRKAAHPLPARALIEAGVAVAVATDFNPGTAPSYHLPLAMMLACTLQGLTPAEALVGATLNAARAVGLGAEVGSLEPGKAADFVIVDAACVEHWLYHFRPNACLATAVGGREIWRAPHFAARS